MHASLMCFAILAGLGWSLIPPGIAMEDKPTSKVEGSFVIPGEVASFEGRVVEIRLYRHDPRIAGRPADLVEKVELKNLAHTQGKETKKEFTIGAKAALEPTLSYYVTFFILQNGQRTHIGEGEHSKRNLCKVLTNGQPSKIKIHVREIKR